MRRKHVKDGYAKTDAYIDDERRSRARFFVKCPQRPADANGAPNTSRLQSLGVLSAISITKWKSM